MSNLHSKRAWRVWFDRAVNLALLWSAALLIGSGLVLKYRVGFTSSRNARVWGLDGHGWGSLHWMLGLTVIGLASLHILRHRKWLWTVLCSRRSIAFLILLFTALVLALAPLLSPP